MNANVPPGFSHRRTTPRNASRRSRGTWLSQNPAKTASTGRSPSAHASRTWMCARRPMRDEALAGAIEGGRRRVVDRQLALRGEERRPPAGPGGELDDLAMDRLGVEPAPCGVELGVPGGVVDGAAGVATASQIPVVVFGGASLVVGDEVASVPAAFGGGRSARAAACSAPRRRPSVRARFSRLDRCQRSRAWPRRARSTPGAVGSGGSRCRPPCRRTPDRAGPSPRDRRGRGRCTASRTTGSRSSLETARATLSSTGRPASTTRTARCRRTRRGRRSRRGARCRPRPAGPGRLK